MLPQGSTKRSVAIWVTLVVGMLALNYFVFQDSGSETIPYSRFLEELDEGRVQEVELTRTQVRAQIDSPEAGERWITAERLPGIDESTLVETLRAKGVEFSGRIEPEGGSWGLMLLWLLPLFLLIAFNFFAMRRMAQGGGAGGGVGGPFGFGKTQAKLYDESKQVGVSFDDVAGIDESVAEVAEVVDYLKQPKKYEALGAKIPKGVLLVGPPGTGKTLLAKAMAGEAGVPFFSITGSDFVEMFVGVGASRVRDLFRQAREKSPCIVFVDEIDAIGKSRGGVGAMATHDEREQTLNQLLSEMEGFDARSGIVVVAATNRPEVLDPALVRAGRFDRQVLVDRPDLAGRLAILRVHAEQAKLDVEVDLEVVARRTPGMVGADLAKVVNEAALAAARRGSTSVQTIDFEEAVDRIQLGLKKEGRVMNEEEKRRVAYHETGHALVAMSVQHADPVHRVSIIPRSIGSLGVTLQLPTEERYLMLRNELLDRICVMLGGRAAEELALQEISTGAQNDLERATETARQMVCRFGMSPRLGPQTFGRPMGARYLDSPVAFGDSRNFSEETAQAIDSEVARIIEGEHRRALELLRERQEVMEDMVKDLLTHESIDRDRLKAYGERAAERSEDGERRPALAGPHR